MSAEAKQQVKKFTFLKIGEANTEIERLTSELQTATQRAEAAEENLATITQQAEQARGESADAKDLKGKLETEQTAHKETQKKLEKAEADLKESQGKQSDFDVKVEKAASAKAREIAASIGVAPITATASANPGEVPKKDLSKLTGLARTRAAFEAQAARRISNNN